MKKLKAKIKGLIVSILTIAISVSIVSTIIYAGSLTPSASPTATSYTLSDIYTRLTTNATATEGNHSLDSSASPTGTMYTLTQIYSAIPTIDASKVLSGTSYLGVDGTVANCSSNGEQSCYATGSYYAGTSQSLSNSSTTVSAGYYGATTLPTVDTDLTASNIASGVNIFGIDGSLSSGGLPDENQTTCYNDTVACTCGEAGCTGDTDWPNQSAQNGEDGNREDDLTIDGCGSGTVLDSLTNLCWERDASSGTMNWKSALQECNNLDLGGHTDWRLPKAIELMTIVDYGYENSSYWHTTKFTNAVANGYWSATTRPNGTYNAYNLYFSSGGLNGYGKTGAYYVVCVREN